jgi:hypothetical protein
MEEPIFDLLSDSEQTENQIQISEESKTESP